MEITKITFRDLSVAGHLAPGSLAFEILFTPESVEDHDAVNWDARTIASLPQSLPGAERAYAMPQLKPPFIGFWLRDFSNPATQEKIDAGAFTVEQREALKMQKEEQFVLKRLLGAPTNDVALMTKLLATLVAEKSITTEFACDTLTREMGIPYLTADLLMEKGVQLVSQGQLQR